MKYLVTSDIHLGHDNTPTKSIIHSFKNSILIDANKDIDILFIIGDLFDKLLYINTTDAQQSIQFFHDLLSYCHDNNIKLRVLEGTPSHDWYQSNILVKLNDIRKHKVDLVYHKVLDIEFISEYNTHVLYIPDEWCSSQEELERQINLKLLERNISNVDMAMLHGQFRYQLQGRPSSHFCYDEAYFLKLVRGYIHIGHYHTHTTFDRIIANGSLERLAHGEEDDKGYVVVDRNQYSFIPNTNAYTYITINVTPKMDITRLDKIIYQLPTDSHVRLYMKSDHDLNQVFQELKVRYSNYHLKRKLKDLASDDSIVTYIDHDDELSMSSHLVLDTNIYETLITLIQNKHNLSPSVNSKVLQYAEPFRLQTVEELSVS